MSSYSEIYSASLADLDGIYGKIDQYARWGESRFSKEVARLGMIIDRIHDDMRNLDGFNFVEAEFKRMSGISIQKFLDSLSDAKAALNELRSVRRPYKPRTSYGGGEIDRAKYLCSLHRALYSSGIEYALRKAAALRDYALLLQREKVYYAITVSARQLSQDELEERRERREKVEKIPKWIYLIPILPAALTVMNITGQKVAAFLGIYLLFALITFGIAKIVTVFRLRTLKKAEEAEDMARSSGRAKLVEGWTAESIAAEEHAPEIVAFGRTLIATLTKLRQSLSSAIGQFSFYNFKDTEIYAAERYLDRASSVAEAVRMCEQDNALRRAEEAARKEREALESAVKEIGRRLDQANLIRALTAYKIYETSEEITRLENERNEAIDRALRELERL